MVKDRLADLHLCKMRNISSSDVTETVIDIKPSTTELEIFVILDKFEKMRQLLQAIRKNIEKMRFHMEKISNAYQASVEKTISKNMEELRLGSITVCRKVCLHFENLKNEQPEPNDESIVARIKRFQFASIQGEFLEIWKQYECLLLDYQKSVKMKLQRTAKIANQQLTETEIETLVANNSTSLFVGNYLEKRDFEENKLRALQDQFLELRNIEQSLIQVHEIFLQLFTSVMEQDAPIQRIGDIVWNAKCDMGVGIQSLNRATELKKKGLKCKIYFILALIIVIFVIIILL